MVVRIHPPKLLARHRIDGVNPAYNVAQIFRDRCARYIETGAPPEWAGIETID